MVADAARALLSQSLLKRLRQQSELDPGTKVFRIADFFSVAQILDAKTLKLTRVSSYSDHNEGVDRLAHALYASASGNDCGGFGAHDEQSAKKLVHDERSCRFVSCWSKNPESHAMWAMYSPDHASVKMQTTVGKLQELCALALADQWCQYFLSDPQHNEEQVALLCEAAVLAAQYEDVPHLLQRLSRRTRLARRLVKTNIFAPDRRRQGGSSSQWMGFLKPSVLKHRAFQYEDEIRVVLRFGWEPMLRNAHFRAPLTEHLRSLQEGQPENLHPLMRVLSYVQPLSDDAALKQCHVALPECFIASACVDPRAPEYKRNFIERYLQARGVGVERSSALGYSYLDLPAYPDRPPA